MRCRSSGHGAHRLAAGLDAARGGGPHWSRPQFGDVVELAVRTLLAYRARMIPACRRDCGMAGRADDASTGVGAPPRGRQTGIRIVRLRIGLCKKKKKTMALRPLFPQLYHRARQRAFRDLRLHLRRDLTPFMQELAQHADRVRTFTGASLDASASLRYPARLDVLVSQRGYENCVSSAALRLHGAMRRDGPYGDDRHHAIDGSSHVRRWNAVTPARTITSGCPCRASGPPTRARESAAPANAVRPAGGRPAAALPAILVQIHHATIAVRAGAGPARPAASSCSRRHPC